jgi:UDP-N-acetyl-2-amino-2-deoxyglucuronate dehydrogenase
MIHACDLHGVKLFVVHQNRYNLPVVKAREALEQGRFGRLVLGTIRLRWMRDQAYYDSEGWRGTWAHDGGVFMNQAAHHLDMLTWFMGDVQSVRSMAATRLVDIECEDTGVGIVRFSSGALGVLEATTATRPKDLEGSISILGEKGSVVIGGFFMNDLITWNFADRQPIDDVVFEQFGKNPGEMAFNHAEYLRDVIASIRTRKAALVDGLEGRKSLELITALYESIETNADVQLRFKPKKCRLGLAS